MVRELNELCEQVLAMSFSVSHQGGAGESGFCYEAGASVEVAPVDALGSGGWGQTRTPKRWARWHSAAHGVEADVDNKSA